MTPQERQLIVQTKVERKSSATETKFAETKFATFLMDALEAHGKGLLIDQMLKAKDFVTRIHAMLKKIEESDAILQGKPSDNNFTEPAIGFLAGLFGGITFAALLANSIKKSQFHKCSCGQIIDLTDWAGRAFQCPSCGTGWEQMAPRQEPTR